MSPTARREMKDFARRERFRWLMRAPWYLRFWRWLWA